MSARLVIFGDPLSGERTEHKLRRGETLAHALVRLWPRGLDGQWRIYRESVQPDNELAACDLPYHVALPDETYLVVRAMAGPLPPFAAFFVNVGISFLLGKAVEMLTPHPRKKADQRLPGQSPNNQLAGQTNVLRAAGRVPEILGRVRSWPDLLLPPVEVWTKRTQQIDQFFVIGMGNYLVEEPKLGETPMQSMSGASPPQVYLPGTPDKPGIPGVPGMQAPPMRCLRISPEINGLSLITQDESAIVLNDVDFVAATSSMSLPQSLSVAVGKPIAITGTLLNSKIFYITSVPPIEQTVGPYVYGLGGTAVTDELDTNAEVTILEPRYVLACYILGTWGSVVGTLWNLTINPEIGDLLELDSTVSGGSIKWIGIITSVLAYFEGGEWYQDITLNDLDGNPIVFTDPGGAGYCAYNEWSTEPAEPPEPGPPLPETNKPTDWYVVPMANPRQVWIDIAFPQGLATYYQGQRRSMSVQVLAEFRRVGATEVQASRGFLTNQSTTGSMRWTYQVDVGTLGLPATSDYIEVRLTRTTPFQPDSTDFQYIQDTRWERLAGMQIMEARYYPDCTIVGIGLTNSRSATSVGQLSFNAVVTRMLPAWDGSAFSTALYPTRKWADNFVARCMATDGARRDPAQIDLAGIYALQDYLDDPARDGGDLGEISMTLDQMQDIDSELLAVADVVRAVVYRVGRKIFVTRDQATDTTHALINGRTKGPEGESTSTRMTADADNDCVIVTYNDPLEEFRQREYQYPPSATAFNPLRVPTACANWAQAWRRAVYEWNKLRYRRELISVDVSEDGRLCRPGDVVNITDDIATLATSAGEVIVAALGTLTLTLDRDVHFGAGTHSILLRDVAGLAIDIVPCSAVAGAPNKVLLSRAPVVAVKSRDAALGTMYAFYPDTASNVRRWVLTGVEASGPIVKLSGANYSPKVYTGDTEPLEERPPLFTSPGGTALPPPLPHSRGLTSV